MADLTPDDRSKLSEQHRKAMGALLFCAIAANNVRLVEEIFEIQSAADAAALYRSRCINTKDERKAVMDVLVLMAMLDPERI